MKNNNMKSNSKINWWLLIGILIVIAIVIYFITVGITGNIVKVTNPTSEISKCISDCQKACLKLPSKDRISCRSKCVASCPKYADVYTKDEVDALIPDKVLNMLNKCEVVRTGNSGNNGDFICGEKNKKCISGQLDAFFYIRNYTSQQSGKLFNDDFFSIEPILNCQEIPNDLVKDMETNPNFKSVIDSRGGIDPETEWICC